MIEVVRVKVYYSEISTVMFAMTARTIFSFYFGTGMITCACIDPCFDFSMAIEAFCIADLFAKFVTFSTITDSFQIGMKGCKIARRDLSI